ncbi:MAG: hypothetical protein R3E83_04200 [Burkholderiaceae bacterium]
MSTSGPPLTERSPGRAFVASRGHARDAGRSRFEGAISRFLPRARPSADGHRLTVRNIYVLPTRQGLTMGLVMLVMLVCSISYGLALGYALTFLVLRSA